jgi:hypothetical protein
MPYELVQQYWLAWGGDAESTRTDDYVGIRELAPSRNGQRRVRETDGTHLHDVVLSDRPLTCRTRELPSICTTTETRKALVTLAA